MAKKDLYNVQFLDHNGKYGVIMRFFSFVGLSNNQIDKFCLYFKINDKYKIKGY